MTNDKLVTFGRLLLQETDDCVEWPGHRNRAGYGRLTAGTTTQFVHRTALEIHSGESPVELNALHSCHNPACMNHRHLRWGNHSDNAADMIEAGRHRSQSQTHCKNGHPLSGDNLRVERNDNGEMTRRRCKTCQAEYGLRYRAERRRQQ